MKIRRDGSDRLKMEKKKKVVMMSSSIIRTVCILPPREIGPDWKKNLEAALGQSMLGSCTVEHGYIISIRRVVRIVDQMITRLDGNVKFFLDVEAVVLRPSIGQEVDAFIEMIFPHGVFCSFKMLRMMIPLSMCAGFEISRTFTESCLMRRKENLILRKGDKVRVKIQDVRFENNQYTCLASLIMKMEK